MAGDTADKARIHEEKKPSNAIVFTFNPSQISFSRAVKYNRDPKEAHGDPPAQFTGTDATTLTLALLLDAVGAADTSVVQSQIDQLVAWTTVPPDAQTTAASPPRVVFSWGRLAISGGPTFVGFLEQLKVTIEMFERDGTPLRATVNLSLKSDVGPPGGTNPTSGAERSRRRRVLERGQTLQWLAYDEFGDPAAWRAVAELNGIDDPTRVRPGVEVLLPDRSELVGRPS